MSSNPSTRHPNSAYLRAKTRGKVATTGKTPGATVSRTQGAPGRQKARVKCGMTSGDIRPSDPGGEEKRALQKELTVKMAKPCT